MSDSNLVEGKSIITAENVYESMYTHGKFSSSKIGNDGKSNYVIPVLFGDGRRTTQMMVLDGVLVQNPAVVHQGKNDLSKLTIGIAVDVIKEILEQFVASVTKTGLEAEKIQTDIPMEGGYAWVSANIPADSTGILSYVVMKTSKSPDGTEVSEPVEYIHQEPMKEWLMKRKNVPSFNTVATIELRASYYGQEDLTILSVPQYEVKATVKRVMVLGASAVAGPKLTKAQRLPVIANLTNYVMDPALLDSGYIPF